MVRSFLRPHALIAGGALCNRAREPCVRKAVQLSFGFFPCYSGAAARSLVTIVAHHTAARSAGATILPDARGAERPPACCVLYDYDALGTLGGIEVFWLLTLTR